MQERDAAQQLFDSEAAQAEHAANTFEPAEDLEAAAAAAGVSTEQPGGEDANGTSSSEQQPEAAKAPTQDQLTAIKAAIANAQTLEEIQRLEAALTTGHLPSEMQVDGEGEDGQGDKPEGMEVG